MRERILSAFRVLKRVGFALVMLGIACSMAFGAGTAKPGRRNGSFFVKNAGQWEGEFSFMCEVGNAVYYVTPKGMTIDFREVTRHSEGTSRFETDAGMFEENERDTITVHGHVVQIHYMLPERGLQPAPEPHGDSKLSHYSNYFLSRDSTKWRSRVSHYERVVVPEVWPGIDVEYRADPRGVETLYHVKAGANPAQIQMDYIGLDAPLRVNAQGNLILTTSLGEMKEQAPYAFQQQGRVQKEVTSSVRVLGENRIRFVLDHYDTSKELVIDPVLYSSYFGSGYGVYGITPLQAGGIALTAEVESYEFPVSPGAYQDSIAGRTDVMISGLNDDGTEFQFFTYLGAEQDDGPRGLCQADNGIIFVGGLTHSNEWPLTPDAYDTTRSLLNRTPFLSGVSPDGTSLIYSSFISGPSTNDLRDLKYSSSAGRILLCGDTFEWDQFPTTPDALYREASNTEVSSFFALFDPDELEFTYVSLFPALNGSEGGVTANHIAIDSMGTILLCGGVGDGGLIPITDNALQPEHGGGNRDGFFACIDIAGNRLLHSSYWGGDQNDNCESIASINDSTILITGPTVSSGLPVTPNALDSTFDTGGAYDGFWAQIQLPSTILNCSYVGADSVIDGYPRIISIDASGNILLWGSSGGHGFPTTPNADDSTYAGMADWILMKLTPSLDSMMYCTYWGGEGEERRGLGSSGACLDRLGYVWIVGENYMCDYPMTANALYPNCSGFNNNIVARFDISGSSNVPPEESQQTDNESCLRIVPNPSNSSAILMFQLPYAGIYGVSVYNILGQRTYHTKTIAVAPGNASIPLDFADASSGIYFVYVESGAFHIVGKFVILK